MENTGYLCFLIVLKMIGVNNYDGRYKERFAEKADTDFEIIRTAKELGLKVKLTKLKKHFSTS